MHLQVNTCNCNLVLQGDGTTISNPLIVFVLLFISHLILVNYAIKIKKKKKT